MAARDRSKTWAEQAVVVVVLAEAAAAEAVAVAAEAVALVLISAVASAVTWSPRLEAMVQLAYRMEPAAGTPTAPGGGHSPRRRWGASRPKAPPGARSTSPCQW